MIVMSPLDATDSTMPTWFPLNSMTSPGLGLSACHVCTWAPHELHVAAPGIVGTWIPAFCQTQDANSAHQASQGPYGWHWLPSARTPTCDSAILTMSARLPLPAARPQALDWLGGGPL